MVQNQIRIVTQPPTDLFGHLCAGAHFHIDLVTKQIEERLQGKERRGIKGSKVRGCGEISGGVGRPLLNATHPCLKEN